jgi:hypothetical protein
VVRDGVVVPRLGGDEPLGSVAMAAPVAAESGGEGTEALVALEDDNTPDETPSDLVSALPMMRSASVREACCSINHDCQWEVTRCHSQQARPYNDFLEAGVGSKFEICVKALWYEGSG